MTTDIVIHYRDELRSFLECDPGVAYELSDAFSFFVKGYKWMPAFKAGRWDGRIRLFNARDRALYTGLLKNLFDWCKENGYSIAYANKDDFKDSNTSINDEQWNELLGTGKFEPRWYQENAVKYALNNSKSLVLSPTGSGKSYILYLIVRHLLEYYEGDILITVPSTSLVEQLFTDFEDYVNDGWSVEDNVHRLYGGKEKNPDQFYDIILEDESILSLRGKQLVNTQNGQKYVEDLNEQDEIDDAWIIEYKAQQVS